MNISNNKIDYTFKGYHYFGQDLENYFIMNTLVLSKNISNGTVYFYNELNRTLWLLKYFKEITLFEKDCADSYMDRKIMTVSGAALGLSK
jgi:hypothetical protein